MKFFYLFIKSILWLFLFLILIVGGFTFFALQSSPKVNQINFIDTDSAHKSKRVFKHIIKVLKGKDSTSQLTVSQDEIIGLSALAHRAMPELSTYIGLNPGEAKINLSLALPLPRLFKYLNVTTSINNSKFGLHLGDVNIGGISISGNRLLDVITYGLNTFVKKGFGDETLHTIRSVFITDKSIVIGINISSSLTKSNDNKKSPLGMLRDRLSLFGDVDTIRVYQHLLVDYANSKKGTHSLVDYVSFIFTQAQHQLKIHDDKLATEENKAALTALALYFGSNKFQLLIGNVGTLDKKSLRQRKDLRATTHLRQRVDLQKHFIYSIALQLFGNRNTSDAIGEIKEFLDANKGGSGFSFADLLADRAGTRLAMLATQSEESALYVQQLLANTTNEAEMFPMIIGLPESISQKEFEAHYKNVNSIMYQEMLNIIDHRLRELPLYQGM